MGPSPSRFKNWLLQSLEPKDLDRIAPKLTSARLEVRRNFERPGEKINEICFPETGIVSVVARNHEGRAIEAGLIGREGVTGLAVLLGDSQSPNEAYVQVPGAGQTMLVDDLVTAMRESESLRLRLLQYVHNFIIQTSQTALANGRAKIDNRLARWLLMALDRIDGPELALTHEFLSLMLGVRRPGVTDALHRLEGEHLIRSRRASITVRDRAGLEKLAGGFYGVTERDYERVFGKLQERVAA